MLIMAYNCRVYSGFCFEFQALKFQGLGFAI